MESRGGSRRAGKVGGEWSHSKALDWFCGSMEPRQGAQEQFDPNESQALDGKVGIYQAAEVKGISEWWLAGTRGLLAITARRH